MTNTSLVIVIATIMVVGVLGTNVIFDAEALKSKGVGIAQFGSSTGICGLVLCSDYPGGKEAYQSNWSSEFVSSKTISNNVDGNDHTDDHNVNNIIPSADNVEEEFPEHLDTYIHKFELDKISADEALDGIKEVYDAYVNAEITNGIIDGVGDKINLYNKGTFDSATAIESIHLTAEPQNVNPEYQGALDEVIHKFELDKISADEALDGIKEAHYGFVDLYITSDLIEAVEDKIALIDSGKLTGGDAVESIHLTAEPQNVNPEYQGALDEVIHKFELDKISADEALDGIKEAHYGFVDLYITSDLIEAVEDKIALIDSGKLTGGDAVESIHLTAEPQNVNPEYQGALDEVIHKFELDKISADEALDGIKEAHYGFVDLYITSDLIEAVEDKIALIDSGKLTGGDAVESIHLTAEPQNVNPELIGAVDEYLHKYELDKISADEAIKGVTEAHSSFVDLYITSNLVESISIQLDIYESGNHSANHVLHEIHEVIEEESAMAALISIDEKMMEKELSPNTVDMPVGAGVPGCETNDMCYYPTHLTVHAGTTVTWINSDGSIPHTVTAGWPDGDSIGLDYPGGNGFDSDFMSGGAEFAHTFDVPGEYDYWCQLHPWMIGSITVE